MRMPLLILLPLLGNPSPGTELPEDAKRTLDSILPGWKFRLFSEYPDSVDVSKVYGFSNFYECELNGDARMDYALALTVGQGDCLVEYYVALLKDDEGYSCFLLGSYPASLGITQNAYMYLKHRGETVYDYDHINEDTEEAVKIKLTTDALELRPSVGCCTMTLIFHNGKFRRMTSGD